MNWTTCMHVTCVYRALEAHKTVMYGKTSYEECDTGKEKTQVIGNFKRKDE